MTPAQDIADLSGSPQEATQPIFQRHTGQDPVHRYVPFSEKIKFVLFSLKFTFDHPKSEFLNSCSKELGHSTAGTIWNHSNYFLILCQHVI